MITRAERPIDYLEEAVRRAPREARYRAMLAEACLRSGDAARAIEILASSLEARSTPRTIHALSVALLAVDRFGEAKGAASEALRLNPAMDRASYVRGRARRAQGDFTGAIADFRAAFDARHEVEYALAFGRAAFEAAAASPTSILGSTLQMARRTIDAIVPASTDARELRRLGALLDFALEDPAGAYRRLVGLDIRESPGLALLRGLALLETGRGAEATRDLNQARAAPETSAAAARVLATFRERGRVRVTLADAVLAAGEPAWPEVPALVPMLLPAPTEPQAGATAMAAGADDVAIHELDFDESVGPPARLPDADTEAAFTRAREFLADGRGDAAVRELEFAWESIRPGTSPVPSADAVPRQRLQALAEALAAAYERSSRGGTAPRRVRDEELYAAGARFPALLRALVRRFIQDEPRADLFALEVLVTAVESAGVLERDTARDVLRRLAAALRLELDDDPSVAAVRVPLLERLHRARPSLAFPRLYLGRYAVRDGEPLRAANFLDGLAGPLATSPHVLLLRGVCAERLGDLSLALDFYRRAHEGAPQIPGLSYRIGRLLVATDGQRPEPVIAGIGSRDRGAETL